MKKFLIIIFLIILTCIVCSKIFFKTKETSNNEVEELTGKILLYFKNNSTGEIDKEYRNISMQRIIDNMPQAIVEEELKGPESANLSTAIPQGTRVLSVNVEGNEAKVDLSKEFIEGQEGNSKDCLLAIYSIVNSLTEITEINQVKFYIEGKEIESYKGYFGMEKPFLRSA